MYYFLSSARPREVLRCGVHARATGEQSRTLSGSSSRRWARVGAFWSANPHSFKTRRSGRFGTHIQQRRAALGVLVGQLGYTSERGQSTGNDRLGRDRRTSARRIGSWSAGATCTEYQGEASDVPMRAGQSPECSPASDWSYCASAEGRRRRPAPLNAEVGADGYRARHAGAD